jgi:hypothetical protein
LDEGTLLRSPAGSGIAGTIGERADARPLALAGAGIVAVEAVLGLLGLRLGWLQVLVLLVAPGLALMPLLPARVRAVPLAALAAVPALGFAASSVALITLSSAGVELTGVTSRLTCGLLVAAGLAAAAHEPRVRLADLNSWEAAGLAAAVAVGVILQERVIGGDPVPGNDWAKYVLYADEIRRQGSLLIDNPYWMLGVPFREDPGAPAVYGAWLTMAAKGGGAVSHGIWVFAWVGVLAGFAYARAVFGPAAGAIAAAFLAVLPITQDILAWHGLANVAALALIPLFFAYLTQLLREEVRFRDAFGFALVVVGLAAAHRLSFTVAAAGGALALAIQLLRGEQRRRILVGAGRTAAAVAAIGAGVAYDLITRQRSFGGTLDWRSYENTKVELWPVIQDLSVPFAIVALGAVVVTGLAARRDTRLWPPLCMLVVVVLLAYAWIVHVPLVYFRMAYFLPVVLAPLTAFALIRLLGVRRAAIGAAVLALVASGFAWTKANDLRGFYAFANPTALKGLDIVSARLDPGDVVVTDRCWSFLGTWLLHARTLPALEPEDIQPKAELRRARQARAVLAGTPAGRRLADELGVRYLLVDPTCVNARGDFAQPPVTGSPLFVSKRLVILEVGGGTATRGG